MIKHEMIPSQSKVQLHFNLRALNRLSNRSLRWPKMTFYFRRVFHTNNAIVVKLTEMWTKRWKNNR